MPTATRRGACAGSTRSRRRPSSSAAPYSRSGPGWRRPEPSSTLYCSVFLAGGIFFSSGGYATVLQAINGPREVGEDGWLLPREWHWWASEPDRLEWMSSFALFFGTIVFAINIVDGFIGGLGAVTEDRLVWSPDIIGCLLFLIAGFLAMREIGPGWLFFGRRRDLGWWIVAINQVGSVLFMVSAIASFVRPATGDELAVGIANWGTLSGALCFALAGVLQEFERRRPARRRPIPGGGARGAPRRRGGSRRRSSPRSGR